MKYIITAIALATLTACNSTPTLQSGPNAEVTFDGLVRVDNTRLDAAWIRPGIDLSSYDSLLLVGAGIDYRSVRDVANLSSAIRNADEFPLDERQRTVIEESVREAFEEQMARVDGFRLVREEGPNTLAITGALTDVVSFVPPEPIGRADYYLTQLGEATLIIELSDSMSGQVLARGVDRRAIEPNTIIESNRVTNRAELEIELGRWGIVIRNALESLATTPILPAGN